MVTALTDEGVLGVSVSASVGGVPRGRVSLPLNFNSPCRKSWLLFGKEPRLRLDGWSQSHDSHTFTRENYEIIKQ